MHRACHRCGRYVKRKDGIRGIGGYGGYCSDCTGQLLAGLERVKKMGSAYYEKTYGISLKEYGQIYMEQDGVCRICRDRRQIRTDEKRSLAVDHDHATGRVRGLLCSNCNLALGLLNDDVDLIERAGEYLTYQLSTATISAVWRDVMST